METEALGKHIGTTICWGALLLLCGCARQQPVPISMPPPIMLNTDADARLQGEIRRVIGVLEMSSEPRCDAFIVIGAESVGVSRERWTITRCGEVVPYLVTFISGIPGRTRTGVVARRENLP